METFTADAEAHDIGPHSLWRVPVPSDSIEAKGQALNVKNSVQVFIFQGGLEKKKLGSYTVGRATG